MLLWLQRDMKSSPSLEPVMKRDRLSISQNGIVLFIFVKNNTVPYIIISRPIKIQSLPKY